VGGGGAGEVEAALQVQAVCAGVARSEARQHRNKQRGLPQHYWPVNEHTELPDYTPTTDEVRTVCLAGCIATGVNNKPAISNKDWRLACAFSFGKTGDKPFC